MVKEIQALSAMPGMLAPHFETICSINEEIHYISLDEYKGKWLILFFYPHDFDYVSPTDLLGLNDQCSMLDRKNCKILAVSTSSCIIKEKFSCLSPLVGGVSGLKFPLVEDTDCEISAAYSVLKVGFGHSFRAYFIIDPKGYIQSRMVCDLPVGLGVKELVRQVVALQNVEGVSFSEDVAELELENVELSDQTVAHEWYIENCIKLKGSGTYESPINIDTGYVEKSVKMDAFLTDYAFPWDVMPDIEPQPTLVQNNGCSWQVDIPESYDNTLQAGPLDEKIYKLAHYTAHWGLSEHTVDGVYYDGELHFVHYNTNYSDMTEAAKHSDGLAILAVFLEVGDAPCENACVELKKIVDILPAIETPGMSAPTYSFVEHENLIPTDESAKRDYWSYFGSTTMGYMTENVFWIIVKESIKINAEFVGAFQNLRFNGGMPMMANYKPIKELGKSRHVMEPGYGEAD